MALKPYRNRFLKAVLQGLDAQGVPFCISRNYQEFWQDGPSDVDIMVLPESLQDAIRAIRHAADQTGYRLSACIRFANVCLVFHGVDAGFVRIDLDTVVRWRSRTLLSADKILAGRVERDGLPVPASAHEALVLLCQSAWSGKLKESYRKRLMDLANPEDDADQVCDFLDESYGFNRQALSRLIAGGDVGELRQCFRHGPTPQQRIRNTLALLLRSFQRAVRPPGIVIECTGIPEFQRENAAKQMELLFPSAKAANGDDAIRQIVGTIFRGGILWAGDRHHSLGVCLGRIWSGRRHCFLWTLDEIHHPASGESAAGKKAADFIGQILADSISITD
jgi:hypothetical protein